MQGSGFRVQGSGFRVQGSGSGCRVQGAGFRVQGSGFRVEVRGAPTARPARTTPADSQLRQRLGRGGLSLGGWVRVWGVQFLGLG